jgi:hypothetical protein
MSGVHKFYMFIPLELALRPSRIYAGCLLLAHGLALAGIWLAALPMAIQLMVTGVLMVGATVFGRKAKSVVSGLRVNRTGQVEIHIHQSGWQPANITGQVIVLPWLISLRLVREGEKKDRLTIWPDSADENRQRRLRAWLRWGLRADGDGRI